jgi:hypothetical protein
MEQQRIIAEEQLRMQQQETPTTLLERVQSDTIHLFNCAQ